MTIDLINKFAFADDMPEADLSCPERCLFYALRDVYRKFKSGKLNRESGEAEKNKCIRQYILDRGELEAAKKVILNDASMWKRIEVANIAYNQNKTLENADKFIEAVYGVSMSSNPDKKEGDIAS